MNARKVLEMGGGTMLISLPKDWIRRNGIKKGTSLMVEEISPGKLIVSPIGVEERETRTTVVEYPRDDLSYVINDVTGAYLIGSNVIRVEGKQVIAREDRERMKTVIRRLIGLEIMDEDSKSMTLQFLPEPSGLDPEKIVRRMSSLTGGMLRDTRDALINEDSKMLTSIAERDDEVDRLYFLLVRAIRTATIDPEIAGRYGLAPVECLDYRVLASFLEGLGDTITEFSKRAAAEAQQRPDPRVTREIAEIFTLLEEMEDVSVRSFLGRKSGDRQAYVEVEAMRQNVEDRLSMIAQSKGISTRVVVDLLSMLERMTKIFVDVSDLALPTYKFKDGPAETAASIA